MKRLGRTLLALLACTWLVATFPGCEAIDRHNDDDEPASKPTPDDIAKAALAPKPAYTYEGYGAGVHCPGSYRTFKNRIRASSKQPGPGYEWHHIVNQNDKNKKTFGNRLHCTDNLILLPEDIHHAITGFYNKKFTWTKGKFVRDVIAERSWHEQYKYGLKVLRDHGVKP